MTGWKRARAMADMWPSGGSAAGAANARMECRIFRNRELINDHADKSISRGIAKSLLDCVLIDCFPTRELTEEYSTWRKERGL